MLASWLFVSGCAAWMAAVEVQIEGGYGWSAKTATWRIRNPVRKIVGWPYITGYHLAVWMMTFVFFHIPFLFEHELSLGNWLQMIELWWGFWLIEDFWWFMLNPLWGIKKFFTLEIPWHPKKLLYFPRDYWVGWGVLLILEIVRKLIGVGL
jgi:hypothetical protein